MTNANKLQMVVTALTYLPRAATEVSIVFLQGMVNRMSMSQFKYGDVKDAYPHKQNAIVSMLLRLRAYMGEELFAAACQQAMAAPDTRHRRTTRNTEYLIDAANFAMIEFMHPALEGAVFEPTDADGSTGRMHHAGAVDQRRNNAESEAVRDRLYTREGD